VAETRADPVQPSTGQPVAALPPATGISLGPEPGPVSAAAAATHPSAVPPTPHPSATRPAAAAKPAAPTSKSAPQATTTTTATTVPAAADPISGYSACITKKAAIFTVSFNVAFSWRHAFLDVDGDGQTGYRLDEPAALGADYMVENGVLFHSTGSDWSWSEVGAVRRSTSGGVLRWQVPLASIGSPTGLRVVYNGSGKSPDASTPVVWAGAC